MKRAIVSFVVGSALVFSQTGDLWSQTHKVAAKPESVVRAVGVYEWTGDLARPTASRFVPVTVFIDGELEDAGIYKPQPVPFALLAGNIYELDEAGLAKGTVTLESALHAVTPDGSAGPAFDEGWTAYGSFTPPAAEKKSTALKPSKSLPVIQTSGGGDSGRPHFSNKSGDTGHKGGADAAGKSKDSAQPQPASKPDAGTSPKDTTDAKSQADDPDRPTMHRRTVGDDTASASDTASTTDNGKTSSDDDAERPTLKRRSPEEEKQRQQQSKKKETASVTGSGSLNDDPDRPRLHHGGRENDGDKEPPKLRGVPKDMHQMVAVSDAKNRDPHPFARPWEDSNERAAILAKMQEFARAKLAEYGVVPGTTPATAIAGTATGNSTTTAAAPESGPPTLKRGVPPRASVTTESTTSSTPPDSGPPTLKRGIPPKSSTTTTTTSTTATATQKTSAAAKTTTKSARTNASAKGRKHATAAPAQVVLADEDLRGYTLSYGGAPTYIYMAHTVETGSVMRYVTIVAQADATGNLKVALASATDAAHLDRTPWMRLVDVVDVEASNRASLLFELRGQSSRQFALYRVIATRPEQIFTTGSAM